VIRSFRHEGSKSFFHAWFQFPRPPRQAEEVKLGVTRQTLHRILAGTASVTPEMAVRLGKFCGNGPALWLNLQVAHDLWHAERRLRAAVARIPSPPRAA
jgi:addiction module HigA family antidote